MGVWTNLVAAAALSTAIPGLIPPQDTAAIAVAEDLGNKALSAWGANLNQPLSIVLEAEFFALLPGIATLIATVKAKHATAVTAPKK
jgi:ABC-type antimicrobial peptide transport system permease subunit